MYRIFVVEDDAVIAGAVQRHLESWGYQVKCAERFDDVLSEFAVLDPQLVLLDISLPFFNGYHWCREIRKVSKVPILFLTSASDDMNLVMAMEMGGDDLLATVLIIYYKQISEGYEDQRRYHIMQQVGMSRREVGVSIRGQILLVFFLPLLAAGLHILAAFPMLCRILELFGLYDVGLFALCTAGTLAVFAAVYAMVYGLTARTYERIVGGTV